MSLLDENGDMTSLFEQIGDRPAVLALRQLGVDLMAVNLDGTAEVADIAAAIQNLVVEAR